MSEDCHCCDVATTYHLLGISSGLKVASGDLRAAAGEAYMKGRDEEAELLRDHSQMLDKRAKTARNTFEEYQAAHEIPDDRHDKPSAPTADAPEVTP